MAYTDKELLVATQIAYLDLEEAFTTLQSKGQTPPFTISELLAEKGDLSQSEKDHLGYLDQDLMNELFDTWEISFCYDTNDTTGFYGCVIETGESDAIVAFRGSEDITDPQNQQLDWINADLGLLNSLETDQQGEAEKMLNAMIDSGLMDKYDNITSTGHSLGGNLAEFFSICMAKYGLDYKLQQCVSYDGPGFSNKFINENSEYIDTIQGKIVEYKWSFVGPCLYGLSNNIIYADVSDNKDNLLWLLYKHAPSEENLSFDENGMIVQGELGYFEQMVGFVSKTLDKDLYCIDQLVEQGFLDDNGNLTEGAKNFITNFFFMVCDVIIIKETVKWILIEFIGSMVCYCGVALVESLTNAVCELLNLSKDIAQEIKNGVLSTLNTLRNVYNLTFNAGYKYAEANSEISVNTDSLRNYANRLNNVNSRITNLDSRMNGLYRQVGYSDLWTILKANILTGYSYTISSCANYLNNTANDFDDAETTVKRLFS